MNNKSTEYKSYEWNYLNQCEIKIIIFPDRKPDSCLPAKHTARYKNILIIYRLFRHTTFNLFVFFSISIYFLYDNSYITMFLQMFNSVWSDNMMRFPQYVFKVWYSIIFIGARPVKFEWFGSRSLRIWFHWWLYAGVICRVICLVSVSYFIYILRLTYTDYQKSSLVKVF